MAIRAEVIAAVKAYGEEVLAMEKISDVCDPVIQFEAADLLAMISEFPESREIQVGICNTAWMIVDKNFGRFDDDMLTSLKSKILVFACGCLDSKSIDGLADTILYVYRRLDREWPELVQFVMGQAKETEIGGSLFVRFITTTDSEFQDANSDAIIDIITVVIGRSSASVQTALIVLLAGMAGNVLKGRDELFEKLWEAALNITTVDPKRAEKLSEPMDELYKLDCVQDQTARVVTEFLEKIDNWETAKPLMKLMPYLTFDVCVALIEKLRLIAERETRLVELVSFLYESIPLSEIPLKVFRRLIIAYKSNNDDSHFAVSACLDSVNENMNIFNEVADGTTALRTAIVLKSIELTAREVDDFILENGIDSAIIDMLGNEEDMIRHSGFDCVRSLIEHCVLTKKPSANHIISYFPKLRPADHPRFFELLNYWLDADEVDVEIVERIFDFAYIMMRQTDKYTCECVNLFANLCKAAEDEMMEAVIDDVTPYIISLVKSSVAENYVVAITTMIRFMKVNHSYVMTTFTSLLHDISSVAETGSHVPSRSLSGELIAMACDSFEMTELVATVTNLITDFMNSGNERLIISAARMGKHVTGEMEVFDTFLRSAMSVRTTVTFNPILRTIRKFIQNNTACVALPLAQCLISGGHPIFNKRPPTAFNDSESQIYKFLAAVKGEEVEATLLKWFDKAQFSMLGIYIEALGAMEMSASHYSAWVAVLSRRMTAVSSYRKEMILNIIMKILRSDKTALDIDFFVSQLSCLWNDDDNDDCDWRTTLGSCILELCGMEAEMDEETIEDILADYPFDEMSGKCCVASDAIVAMIDSGRWDSIAGPVALCFSHVLTKSVQKMKKLQITGTTRSEMTRILKTLCANPTVERVVREQLGNSEMLSKRLEAVIG